MKLPDAKASYFRTKFINTPNEPCLVITVCEDEEGERPMGMLGLHLFNRWPGEVAEGARELERQIDEWVEAITFQPL